MKSAKVEMKNGRLHNIHSFSRYAVGHDKIFMVTDSDDNLCFAYNMDMFVCIRITETNK